MFQSLDSLQECAEPKEVLLQSPDNVWIRETRVWISETIVSDPDP